MRVFFKIDTNKSARIFTRYRQYRASPQPAASGPSIPQNPNNKVDFSGTTTATNVKCN